MSYVINRGGKAPGRRLKGSAANKLTQIKTKVDPICYGTIRNKLSMHTNQTSTVRPSGSVTLPSDNETLERQTASNQDNQRQIHAPGNSESGLSTLKST